MIERLPDDLRAVLHREQVPDWRGPMLATLTDKGFSDPQWILELKFGSTDVSVGLVSCRAAG